jgi:hypothetical protein
MSRGKARLRGFTFVLIVSLSTLIVAGCGPAPVQPADTPTITPPETARIVPIRTQSPSPAPTEAAKEPAADADQKAPEQIHAALDAALAYLISNYGDQAPAPSLAWTAERTTAEGIVGAESYRYTAQDWEVTISCPVVAPEAVIYHVMVVNRSTGFQWAGEIDAAGRVSEQGEPGDGLSVGGWMGCVVSLAAGSQYDDYLALQPEGAGELGLTGANAEIEAQIVALRDKDEPGKYAHFWGWIVCGVPDYGGCQLTVTRVRIGTEILGPEPIEAWEGTIVSNPPGAQFDDYFVLAGDFPVGFGIAGTDPAIKARLEELRDTGIGVQVWGQLRTGVPDAFGAQLELTRIEGVEHLPAPTPVPQSQTEGEAVEGWIGTVVKLPPGNQFGRYFRRCDGERFDIGTTDEYLRQQINDAQWTGAQIQVWGTLFAGVPAAEARHIEVERLEFTSGPAEEARDLTPFATTTASSHLPTDHDGQYQSWIATDGAIETAWVEGAAGSGLGEWVQLTFPGTIEVHSIGLDVGYDRDADIFAKNNRIKEVTLIFSNGEQVELGLADTRGMQTIPLVRAPGPNIETTFVKVVIDAVYPGSTYDDTCLAEIEVWGTAH